MFLKRQTPYSILCVVWYFTGGNQQNGTFNIVLLLEQLEQFSPYYSKGAGDSLSIQNDSPVHYVIDNFCDVPFCLDSVAM